MKRIFAVMAVMAIMAAMVAASAMPAFAKGQPPCKGNQQQFMADPAGSGADANGNGIVCYNFKTNSFVDDRS